MVAAAPRARKPLVRAELVRSCVLVPARGGVKDRCIVAFTTRARAMTAATISTVPPDPTGAATPVEFARRLRALMAARRRSLDSVARRSRDAGTPISRATVHNLITAGGSPRRESLVRFLQGCGVPPREQVRWLIKYDEVYPEGRRGVTR
jgi:hypothetical protein